MSGICGFVSREGLPPESGDIIREMSRRLAHRGPDGGGCYVDDHAALGLRHLSTGGLQGAPPPLPLTDETSRCVLVFDGAIYNHLSLRRELQGRGHRFKTGMDSETVLHLYQEMGRSCVSRLRGMFAFALWDSRERQLFLARDRFGIKPLYYAWLGSTLVFASEPEALFAFPGLKPAVNLEMLPHYLTFQYVPDPETMFQGVRRLLPAHYLAWDFQGAESKRYWQLRFNPVSKPLSHFIDLADSLLKEAVRLHMSGDVPRGAFLSSGIDSSSIAALMRRREEVNTYSVGCAGGRHDELAPARETASLLGTRHREKLITPEEFWSELPRILRCLGEPVADPAAIALFFAARLAAEEVKVILSGEGADEAFGGYQIYREPLAVAPVQGLPAPLKNCLRGAADRLPAGFKGKNYLHRATAPLEKRYYGNALIFPEAEKEKLLNRELFPTWSPAGSLTAPYFKRSRHLDDSTRMQHLDFYTWLPGDILVKADRMTAAHSLELRVPYLDHRLVEFAATIPRKYKLARGTTKYLLRRTAAAYLPNEVCRRPKLGFPVPIAAWIRKHYYGDLEALLRGKTAATYFNLPYLEEMLSAHGQGRADYGRRLWTVAIFLLWHQLFLEQ